MRLKTIAVALGAAAAMPSAFADVTLSGNINAGPAYLHQGNGSSNTANSFIGTGPTAQQGISRSGINTNYSNVTIGSMEDLGGGLKLDFAFQIIAPFQGNQGVQNRNSHIGLVGDSWGGVWVGTNEQLYERYMYTVDPLDGAAGIGGNLQVLGSPGFGTVFDQPAGTTGVFGNGGSMIGQAGFYRRQENAVWYDSPNWGGFTFGAYTTLSTFRSNATGTIPGLNPSIWGVGAKYVGPVIPVQVWAAYEHHKDMFGLNVISTAGGTGGNVTLPGFNGATSSRDQGFQVGVGYTLGDIFLFGNFERLKYKTDGIAGPIIDRYRRDAWSVGLKWNVPTGYVGAQYIQAQNGKCDLADGTACNADNTAAKMVGLGYYHTLSKQTQAYVMATYIKNDSLQSYLPAGGGDPSGTGLPVNLGGNVWGATVGLKHSF
jgi:predicted porin